jgi:CRISPR/Cas system-associated exonuclease Cas4 (RecB family)
MKTFLEELALRIFEKHRQQLEEITVVFPNRRAILYFRKHLSQLLDKPVFSPRLQTIEDFIAAHSSLKVPDKLELVHRLHHVYHKMTAQSGQMSESFDQFYFWGDMLLRDFEEVDKYMVNALYLFKDLSQQKEIDATFDFLTPEQIEFLKGFWLNFDEKDSANKGKFLRLWRQLPDVYNAFRANLQDNGLAYEGMVQRLVAEKFVGGQVKIQPRKEPHVVFAGFNALTKSEEVIISTLVDQGVAEVHWDIDAYYFNNNTQEAGKFFREYEQHKSLKKTFQGDVPANFLRHMKGPNASGVVHLYGASQSVGQAKAAAKVLEEVLKKGAVPEETVIVLPDEKMLMPVLHSVTGPVEKLNVTMGFPLSSTPLFNLVELLIDLQLLKKDGEFNHRPVTALLGHPYVVAADAPAARTKTKEIINQSWVSIPKGYLATTLTLHRLIFQEVVSGDGNNLVKNLITYLRDIITELGALKSLTDLDREYCFHFLKLVNRMEEVIGQSSTEGMLSIRHEKQEVKSFLRLFRQLVRSERIPFTGEPLRGLQIMGVLETRNLDFKNVFILSLNEGAFPSFASKGSYIPQNIRKAYGLPTADFQDAMYAYLFYRVLQRAENVYLFYTTETDDLGEGEMSRYLQQLLYESGVQSKKHVLHNPLQPLPSETITVNKDDRVFQSLARYIAGSTETKSLSPTALNDYIECRLKFYFRYVAGIREAREVEDDLDARILGNFLHRVMEKFYLDLVNDKKSMKVEAEDLKQRRGTIEALIDHVFIESYHLDPEKPVLYEGQRVVVKEVVKRFAEEILKKDIAYAPFEIVGLETRDRTYAVRLPVEGNPEVQLGGSIDRADRKNNVVRVIDYKTGKDNITFEGPVSDLLNRDAERNKAAFQTMMYALLFHKNAKPFDEPVKLVPGLMNRINLFEGNFTFGLKKDKEYVQDATPLLPEFEQSLTTLLTEIYDPAVPFNQTDNNDICKWCPYREICCR